MQPEYNQPHIRRIHTWKLLQGKGKEVGEAHLMHSLQELRKQLIDCNKLPLVAANEKPPRQLSSSEVKAKEKWWENENIATDEKLVNVGLDYRNTAQDNKEEEGTDKVQIRG